MAGKLIAKLRNLADLVKISHTIFALPFALASMLVAAQGLPPLRLFVLVVSAMFFARNAGMAFNRYLDADSDARNPRTASRHIPRGVFSKRFVLAFALTNAALFVFVTRVINPLCFALSPIALILLFGYSFMKRLTHWSHLFLGMVLGSSPVAAWAAVRGTIAPEPFLLGAAVIFWVAGFDLIYATQDYDFDREEGLHSLVVRYGISKSLVLARFFHVATLILFIFFGVRLHFGFGYHLSLMIIAALLFYEHSLVSARDLSKIDAAFFNVNGFISLIYLAGVVVSFAP